MPKVDAEAKTLIATPSKASRFRRVLRISLALVGTHALAWAIGRGQGWWETRAVRDKCERIAYELTETRDLVLRFEARRSLESAQTALDARNFGIAQEQVLEASRLLKVAHPPADLLMLSDALSKFQPVVTENLAGQHQQIAAWLAQLDAALPVQKTENPALPPQKAEPSPSSS
jgi:hypothetical protein